MGEKRPEKEDGRKKTGERGQERVLLHLLDKFGDYNLAAEFIKFLRTLIANQKCKFLSGA